MTIGLAKSSVDCTQEKWEDVQRYNEILERLMRRRKSEISVSGPFVHSKTAWKCAVLQQALLYRVTMLAAGSADMWNSCNVVCSVLCARALLETIAVSDHIRNELKDLTEARALDAIDELANKQLFATRDSDRIAEGSGHQAVNVLTYIDRMSKKLPDVRHAYEFISEWCHPNGSGHFFTYGEINKSTGDVQFFERAPRVIGIQGHVLTIFMMIAFVELVMDTFDECIPKIAAMDPNQGSWLPARC
jgi:hypothetical protein